MTWTYDLGRLGEPLYRVRRLVRDTDETDQLVQDEEIVASLADNGGSFYRAAADICDQIALDLGRELDLKGPFASTARDKFDQYRDMAKEFRSRSRAYAKPAAGGISRAAKAARESDADRVVPAFTRADGEVPALDQRLGEC